MTVTSFPNPASGHLLQRGFHKISGRLFYIVLSNAIKDLHHLQGLEDRMNQMEEQVLSGEPEQFNPQMTALRKEIFKWIRYYTQLDDMVCEFQEKRKRSF